VTLKSEKGNEGLVHLKIQKLADEYSSLLDQKILLARRVEKLDDLIT